MLRSTSRGLPLFARRCGRDETRQRRRGTGAKPGQVNSEKEATGDKRPGQVTINCGPTENQLTLLSSPGECAFLVYRKSRSAASDLASVPGTGTQPAFTLTLVVMNWAVPGLTTTGSGCGPAGVGIMAGD